MPLVEKVAHKDHEAIYEKFITVCDHAKKLLSEREYTCFVSYYRDHKTMQTIANELGVSKQRVNQHLTFVIGKLKKCLSKRDL
jgi:RNA polymerase sigma factor (sigma-70 family)